MNADYHSNKAEAKYNEAVLILENDGSPEGVEQAMTLFKEASVMGHVPSMCAVGVLYDDNGDPASAVPYLVQAANLGDQGALDALASVYRHGNYAIREQIAREAIPTTYKAVSRFKKGDKHADVGAQQSVFARLGYYFDRFNYYAPAVVGSFVCAAIGFGLGMEYCPFYYIVPCMLAILGSVIRFFAFRGAKMGKLWPNR